MHCRFTRNIRRDTTTCFFCGRVVVPASLVDTMFFCSPSLMDLLLRWPPGTSIPLNHYGRGIPDYVTIFAWAESPTEVGTFLSTRGDIHHIEDYHPEYIPQPGH